VLRERSLLQRAFRDGLTAMPPPAVTSEAVLLGMIEELGALT